MPNNSNGGGLKLDQGKKQWYAMPLEVLELLADVFAAGEKKYATFNCLSPFVDGDRRFFDAAMRHLKECQINPLAIDAETGCFHGVQAAWNLLMRTYHAEKERNMNACPECDCKLQHSGNCRTCPACGWSSCNG